MEKLKHPKQPVYQVWLTELDIFVLVQVGNRIEPLRPWIEYKVDSRTGVILDFVPYFDTGNRKVGLNDE